MILNGREQLLCRTQLHWGMILLPGLLLLVLILPMIVVQLFVRFVFGTVLGTQAPVFLPLLLGFTTLPAVIALGVAWLSHRRSEITLTTERLCWETGFLFRATGELSLRQVESMFLVEPLLGRVFGYGSVSVIGTGGTRFPLAYLPNPAAFHRQLQAAVRVLQEERVRPPEALRPVQAAAGGDARYQPR
jgi:hypothetical protein